VVPTGRVFHLRTSKNIVIQPNKTNLVVFPIMVVVVFIAMVITILFTITTGEMAIMDIVNGAPYFRDMVVMDWSLLDTIVFKYFTKDMLVTNCWFINDIMDFNDNAIVTIISMD
jgi:hypothetical protein